MSDAFTALRRLGAPIATCAACGKRMRQYAAGAGTITQELRGAAVTRWFCSMPCLDNLTTPAPGKNTLDIHLEFTT